MILFAKIAVGAVLIILIHLVALSKNFLLSALIPLFPTFTLIALSTIGMERSIVDLQKTILFGMVSMVPYFLYMLAMYLTISKFNLHNALMFSTGCWVIAAVLVVYSWKACELRKEQTLLPVLNSTVVIEAGEIASSENERIFRENESLLS